MAKKKKSKSEKNRKTFEKLVEQNPHFKNVIHEKSWDYIGTSDKGTVKYLAGMWGDNIRANAKNKMWKKHEPIAKDCNGIGKNKAVIGVGAGASFNLNRHVLHDVVQADGRKDIWDRDFLIVASNHQYKPLLRMGIVPDFVLLADASDVVTDQLINDVPKSGTNTILLAGMHCDPGVLQKWTDQGKCIRFYLTSSPGMDKVFKEATGKNPKPYEILQGGNVLNSAWSIGLKWFCSSVFMAVGNDLSYKLIDDDEERRNKYYADGDYSSNKATGRDEASGPLRWMGFSLNRKPLWTGKVRYDVEVQPVGTSKTLWVYKTWLEVNTLANAMAKTAYQYYNCSEGGIAGVMAKDDSDKELRKDDNWFLMDEVNPRWHTYMLADAVIEFQTAKEAMKCRRTLEIPTVAPFAGGLGQTG